MQRYLLFPNKPCVYDDICLYPLILHWVQLSHMEHFIIGKNWKIWSSCELKHGSQLLKCIPKIQHNPFPSVEAGPSDSLPTNKMQPKWSDNISDISLYYDCLSSCLLSLTRPRALFDEASEGSGLSYGVLFLATNWDVLPPTPPEELNYVNSHRNKFKSTLAPLSFGNTAATSWHLSWRLVTSWELENSDKLHPCYWPTETVRKYLLF